MKLKFLSYTMDLNVKLRKVLNERNVTLGSLEMRKNLPLYMRYTMPLTFFYKCSNAGSAPYVNYCCLRKHSLFAMRTI
jgi:hypothetical protein